MEQQSRSPESRNPREIGDLLGETLFVRHDDLGLEEGEFDPRAGKAGNDLGAGGGEWDGGEKSGRIDERHDDLGLEEGEYDPRDSEEGLVSRDRDLGFEEGVYDSRDRAGGSMLAIAIDVVRSLARTNCE
ncbi:hypothetical protein R1sor_004260 [Riccia sorocarpa]|uniref:Uncharacterized protein n=1 Tax=Riccia sorocarpa TaxID=122646 RepID=A0ABD3H402_9MARC